MARKRKRFNVAEVHKELFRSDDEFDSESNESSMDSGEEWTVNGIDGVLDIKADPSSTVTRARGKKSISKPSPAKRRVSRRPGSSSHTSAGQKPSAKGSKNRARPAPAETTPPTPPTPPPAAEEGRWCDPSEKDEEPPPLKFCPKRTPGVQLDFQKDYKPSDIFRLFFSKDVLQDLCRNTNKYAARRTAEGMLRQWTDVNADEMLRFLSVIIYLGLVRPSAARDMWRRDRLHSHPFPTSVMAGYRYEAISAYLHMSDPAGDAVNNQLRGQPGYDRLFCLKPLMEQILTACRTHYHPHQNLAIDERMVATKARIGMKRYMKDKPTKWGFKLFVLADSSSGYTCDFNICQGKAKSPSGNGLSFDAVVNLLHVPYLGTGYTVYVDNFYTSSQLFRHLHGIGFGACGTIRQTRIGFPRTTNNDLPKNADRGDLRWIRDGPLLFVKWRDTRDVTLCSTVHKAFSGQSVQRRIKNPDGTWSIQKVPVPEPVMEYNKFMGGVDLSDALIKYFSVTQKSRRWYVKLFLHFIDIAVVNSFIIHKEMALARQKRPLTQKRFRELLCMELADCGNPQASTTGKGASGASSSSLAQGPGQKSKLKVQCSCMRKAKSNNLKSQRKQKSQGCFPIPVCQISTNPFLKASQGRRRCVRCKMKTMFKCKSCDVPLCLVVDRVCFTDWHEEKSS
ncbi:piggyBac transposable element-derived protein 4 [Chanos chanos]|uniref:PiggyBac transposable element-derived protein 4 n=1 Tax=Chanos chanos TaxID=29144 RepID=A0A6J2V3Y0_CHACN|nr:piggyBac transposable element-derived protein 4-like [Chanos chanos]